MKLSCEFSNDYSLHLAKLEEMLHHEKFKEEKKINSQLRKYWSENHSIHEIYDFETGGVFFHDFEWELNKDKNLCKLFSETYLPESYKFLTDTEFGKVLRGPECYYFLVCEKEKRKPTSSDLAILWIKNLKNFISRVSKFTKELSSTNEYDKKFVLAICDHLRLGETLALTYLVNKESDGKNFVYNFTKQNKNIYCVAQNFSDILKFINSVLFSNNFNISVLTVLIKKVVKDLDLVLSCLHNEEEKVVAQSFKIHRELDCFLENLMAVKHGIAQTKVKNACCFGVMNGGVELPFIACMILNQSIDGVYLVGLNNSKLYLDRHNDNIDNSICCKNLFFKHKQALIFDDNSMTGMTIDACQQTISNFFEKPKTILVRHPNLNRLAQSKNYNKVTNLCLYGSAIFGMLFDSPFSKIKSNTNYGNEFLDELGVFTLTGDIFLKRLYKNLHFKANSEVGSIKGLLNEK